MKKKWFGRILIGFVILLVVIRLFAQDAPAVPYYTDARPAVMVIAHQGGDGVWPGDSMYAFQHAVDLGVDVLEMDAHITKDSQIVLMHDERVDRTTDGSGWIEDKTLAELKGLDAAYKWSSDDGKTFPFRGQGIQVPTLEELFQAFPQMRYLIEIKLTANPIDRPLCELIRKYKMEDKVIVASFHDDAMAAFRQTCPQVATSASKGEVTPFVLLGKIGLNGLLSPKFVSLQVPFDPSESYNIPVMTKWFIKQSHNKNVKVEPWTVDDPALMREYIAWGVDGIITDRPDLMLEVLGK
jgi:glycerophosphoryl diester phosphodiesterase